MKLLNHKSILKLLSIILIFSGCEKEDQNEPIPEMKNTIYKVHFVYDKNINQTDKFSTEVESVNLYVFDDRGILVEHFFAEGNELSQPDFCIEFDDETVSPGKYTFLAWCGVKGDQEDAPVMLPKVKVGETRLSDMSCRLKTNIVDSFGQSSSSNLPSLFYGISQDVDLPAIKGESYDYTVNLLNDTNHFEIRLYDVNDRDMNGEDYEIFFEFPNRVINYQNIPEEEGLESPVVTYLPWSIKTVEENSLKYLSANLSTLRLMADWGGRGILLIIKDKKTGEYINKIPVIDYILVGKSYIENASDQEFLDLCDEYFFNIYMENNKCIQITILFGGLDWVFNVSMQNLD